MGLIKNIRTLITSPTTANNYARYCVSKLLNGDQAIRTFPDGIKIGGFTGFSEFNTSNCATLGEWKFLRTFKFDHGDIIDIGANLGLITAVMAKRFPDRRVHAFEPNPSTYQSLINNIEINKLVNVRAQRYAVGETEGSIRFRAYPRYRATSRIATSPDESTISVPCTILDAYIVKRDIEKIAFLKLDVEGHETEVLRGALHTLEHIRPQVIYYEVCPSLTRVEGYDPYLPTKMLLERDYSINEIDKQGCLKPADLSALDYVSCNWVATAN